MPCFIIADLETSISLNVDKLGFVVRYIGPDENPIGLLSAAILFLSICTGPLLKSSRRWPAIVIDATVAKRILEAFKFNRRNSGTLPGFDMK